MKLNTQLSVTLTRRQLSYLLDIMAEEEIPYHLRILGNQDRRFAIALECQASQADYWCEVIRRVMGAEYANYWYQIIPRALGGEYD